MYNKKVKNYFSYKKVAQFVGYIASIVSALLPKKDRTRVIVQNNNGQVLVIKNYFSRQQWALPGGGIKRGESFEQAARREVLEELGVEIGHLRYVGRVKTYEAYRPFMVRVYSGVIEKEAEPRCNFEIMDWRWMRSEDLPKEYRNLVKKVV